jgi:hypothetical protein
MAVYGCNGAFFYLTGTPMAVDKIQLWSVGHSPGMAEGSVAAACNSKPVSKTLRLTEILLVVFQIGIQAGTRRFGGIFDFMKQ